MLCLRNEVIFIFQNRRKMNDPKTHGLYSFFKTFETLVVHVLCDVKHSSFFK